MRKKTIASLFIPGIILEIIGGILYIPGYISFLSAMSTYNTSGGSMPSPSPLFLLGAVVAGIGGILYLISWIGSLVATGKQSRWGWFVEVFLLGWLGQIIYLAAGPGL
jgi:hypothetical protein